MDICRNLFIMSSIIILTMICVRVILKLKRPILSTAISMLGGILTLITLHATEAFTQISMPVSLLSIGISAVMGIPGVALLAVASIF